MVYKLYIDKAFEKNEYREIWGTLHPTSSGNILHYNNQKTDMNMINRPYSDFYSFKYTQVYASFWRIINRIILNKLNGILKKYY